MKEWYGRFIDFLTLVRCWWRTDWCGRGCITMTAVQAEDCANRGRADFAHGAELRTWWYPNVGECGAGWHGSLKENGDTHIDPPKPQKMRPITEAAWGTATAGDGNIASFTVRFDGPDNPPEVLA